MLNMPGESSAAKRTGRRGEERRGEERRGEETKGKERRGKESHVFTASASRQRPSASPSSKLAAS
jgi:hypothetical protein